MIGRLWMGLVVGALCFLVNGAAAEEGKSGVVVEKHDAVVDYKTFDPMTPSDVPDLKPGEDAYCEYTYFLDIDTRYTFMLSSQPGKVELNVNKITLKLDLKINVFTPSGAPVALKQHEEGHRAIAEAFYKDAETIARTLAEKRMGVKEALDAKSRQKAADDFVQKLNKQLTEEYLAAINEPCLRAQQAYDQMTDHGKKDKPTAREAVEKSIEIGKTPALEKERKVTGGESK